MDQSAHVLNLNEIKNEKFFFLVFLFYFSLDALANGWPLECQDMPIMHNMTRANVTIIKLENYHVLFCCNRGLSTGDMSLFRKEMINGSQAGGERGGSSAMHSICIYGFSVPLCYVV